MNPGAKIIGGVFALPGLSCFAGLATNPPPTFLGARHHLFANARSALCELARALRSRTAWLPSYLCESVVRAFVVAGIPHRFYPVPDDLSTRGPNSLEEVQPGDLVLVIDYFGFPADRRFFHTIKERGAWAVEDASQALLTSGIGGDADFVILSPRKFLGVPDGGILLTKAELELPANVLEPPPAEWWLQSLCVCHMRRDFDQDRGPANWFELQQRNDRVIPCGPIRMSDLSRALLGHAFDYREIAARRRANYQHLLAMLKNLALFDALPDGVVPLGFPVCVANRDELRRALFAEKIFPPVHWPIAGVVPNEFTGSHRLSREILTLVCDQRYDAADMERTASIVMRSAQPTDGTELAAVENART